MRLVVFFSRGISLGVWKDSGLFERELKPYKKLIEKGNEVLFVSYGAKQDKKFIPNIHPITLLHNTFHLPADAFSFLSSFLFYGHLKNASAYKTNQINGWWAAGLAKFIFRKPLIVRCGYLLSTNQEQPWKNYSKVRIRLVSLVEKWAFEYADTIIVTTPEMKYEAIKRYNIVPEKINIIPNSVDIDLFRPSADINKIKGRIGFVGRFTPQKNIHLLIQALSGRKDTSLMLIGDGPLRPELGKIAKELNVEIHFMGNIPNSRLPEILNSCQIFVLPSGWEGMPKALLEAMACGLPVIGADVPGIRNVIENEKTGLICRHDANDIRNAIRRIFDDKALAAHLGNHARQYIVENFSLEKAVEKEIALLKSLHQKCH